MSSADASRHTDPQAVIEELRVLVAKSVQGNVKLFHRLSNLVKEATQGMGAGAPSRELPKGNELLARWLNLNFACYSLLTDHSIAFLDDLLSAAEKSLGVKPPAKQEEQAQEERRIGINLNARVGETVAAPFMMENQHSSPLEVSFEAADFVSLKGEAVSADCIKFEPSRLSLQPQEQAIVKSIVTILDDFKVGETYVTTINVLGFQAKDIALLLTILPPLNEKKALASAGGKKKARAPQTKKGRKGKREE